MHTQHHGSCLCGAVRFEVEGAFERFYLCHCSHCRKDTGSAHAANLFSSTARLVWLSGQEHVRTFNLAQTRHTRCFCSICGSALPFASSNMLVVPAGSLDSELAIAADANIFTASRAAWDHGLAAAPGFEAFPS
ncbi:MAG: GFA family protein [Proteobacteria bacterium]|nr:GFA family protein [Pseudomonadota bacterium]